MKKDHINKEHRGANFTCDICRYSASSKPELNRYLENHHRFENVNNGGRRMYPNIERKNNGLCFFWNNGNCKFEEFCRFSHEEIPRCRFDEKCRNNNCKYFHTVSNDRSFAVPFLYNRSLNQNPSPYQHQRRQFGSQGAQTSQGGLRIQGLRK